MSEPIRKVMSDKATLVYGFEDGHCDVEVKLALLPVPVKLRLDFHEVPQAAHALADVLVWNELHAKGKR